MTPHTRKRWFTGLTLASAFTLVLTGCGMFSDPAESFSDEPLNVLTSGDGAWLHPDYANGFGEPMEYQSTLCGFYEDKRIHSVLQDGLMRVEAVNMDTDELDWYVDGVMCSQYSVLGDAVYMFGISETEGHIQLGKVDAATGQGDAFHSTDIFGADFTFAMSSGMTIPIIKTVGAADGVVVFDLEDLGIDSKVLAVNDSGEEVWRHEFDGLGGCTMLDSHVRCGSDAGTLVFETATGNTVLDDPSLTYGVRWASDGYTVDAEEYGQSEFFTLDGTSQGVFDCCVEAAPYSDLIGLSANPVHFSLEDLKRTEVQAVAPDGSILIRNGEEGFENLDGEPLALARAPRVTSPDGSVYLIPGGEIMGPLDLYLNDRTHLGEISGDFIDIAYGYLIVRNPLGVGSYQFYPPAR